MSEEDHRMPRWVKVSGIVAVAAILAGVGVAALGGHDPGSRGNHFGGSQEAGDPGSCTVEPIEHDGGSGGTIKCSDVAGKGDATHRFACRGAAFVGLQVDRDLDGGQVTVTVKDGGGATVHSESYAGGGRDDANIDGADGTWTVSAVRSEGFAGSFTVQIFCGSH